jgi:hypothetical protein
MNSFTAFLLSVLVAGCLTGISWTIYRSLQKHYRCNLFIDKHDRECGGDAVGWARLEGDVFYWCTNHDPQTSFMRKRLLSRFGAWADRLEVKTFRDSDDNPFGSIFPFP